MAMRLNLFIGGPGHSAHEKMVTLALSDPAIRMNFNNVKAFDDEQANAASEGAASWRNYLRDCDVAIFLLPATGSGTLEPRTNKFYTQLEVEQAHLSGTSIYLLIERGTHEESELVSVVKAVYKTASGLTLSQLQRIPKRHRTRISSLPARKLFYVVSVIGMTLLNM